MGSTKAAVLPLPVLAMPCAAVRPGGGEQTVANRRVASCAHHPSALPRLGQLP